MSQAVALAVIVGVVGGLTGAWLMTRDDQRGPHLPPNALNGRTAARASKPRRRTSQVVSPH